MSSFQYTRRIVNEVNYTSSKSYYDETTLGINQNVSILVPQENDINTSFLIKIEIVISNHDEPSDKFRIHTIIDYIYETNNVNISHDEIKKYIHNSLIDSYEYIKNITVQFGIDPISIPFDESLLRLK